MVQMVKFPGTTTNNLVDQTEVTHKNLFIFTAAFMNFAVVLWLAIYWIMGLSFSANVPLAYQLISVISLAYYFKTKNFETFKFVQLSLFLFAPFVMQWSLGSSVTSSGVTLWALLAPIGALVVGSWRTSIPWFFAYIVLTLVSGVFDYFLGTGNDSGVPMKTIGVFFAMNFAVMSSLIFLLIRHFIIELDKLKNQLTDQRNLLEEEQVKSEQLLLNILPGGIAKRMQTTQGLIADKHDDVTVMFADLVNFTQLIEALSPEQMLALLNTIFTGFDELAEKYSLEKIKTVGDAYMVAGGLSQNKVDYTSDITSLAYEMRDFVANHPDLAKFKLALHIGIATGSAVAGVIGSKRFIYDMWGETVNLAHLFAKDESATGIIRVDKTTYNRVRLFYLFEQPVTIAVKGKGDVVAYHLTSKLG
ncbi:MAG: adenylate/guanylate cyclase domain-containing protein [Gallionella sp.]|nr:adenylate/guanylate cyclase domain-containing protein [Gallionella sp.]